MNVGSIRCLWIDKVFRVSFQYAVELYYVLYFKRYTADLYCVASEVNKKVTA